MTGEESIATDTPDIESIKSKISGLPLIDVTVLNMLALLNDPNSNFQQVVKNISPEITARFIQTTNTAYYGVEVKSIDYAVRVLGFSKMIQVITTSILIDHFSKAADIHNFDFRAFNDRAHLCGSIARTLGKMFDYGDPGELFTTAMLIDIGKMLIAFYFIDEGKQIDALVAAEGISTHEAEKRIIGLDHAEIGAYLLEDYDISQDICEAVCFHDIEPQWIPKETNFQMALIVNASARMADSLEFAEGVEPSVITARLEATISKGQRQFRKKVRGNIKD
ncbi:MAG: HDOD domain-containing protein, partial [Desulfobacterales bacterium]